MSALDDALLPNGSQQLVGNVTAVPETEVAELNVMPIAVFISALLFFSVAAHAIRDRHNGFGLLYSRELDILSTTLLWYSMSITLSLYNKFFFKVLFGGIAYPLSLTAVHMALKGVLAGLILHIIDRAQRARAAVRHQRKLRKQKKKQQAQCGGGGGDPTAPTTPPPPNPAERRGAAPDGAAQGGEINLWMDPSDVGDGEGFQEEAAASQNAGSAVVSQCSFNSSAAASSVGAAGQPSSAALMWKAVPIGVCTGLDIALSNLAIAHFIDLSLYTIVKTSSLIFTYGISIYLGIQPVKLQLTISVAVVVFGVLLAALGKDGGGPNEEPHTMGETMFGVFLTVTSAALGALRWVLTEVLLKGNLVKGSLIGKLKVLLWLSPGAAISVLALALPAEGGDILEDSRFDSLDQTVIIALLACLGGAAAIVLLFAELALVQKASALTLAVAGHLKEVLLVVFAIIVFSESSNLFRIGGMGIAFVGAMYYIYVKSSEQAEAAEQGGQPSEPGRTLQAQPQGGGAYSILDEGSVNVLELGSMCSDNSLRRSGSEVSHHQTPGVGPARVGGGGGVGHRKGDRAGLPPIPPATPELAFRPVHVDTDDDDDDDDLDAFGNQGNSPTMPEA